MERSTIHIGLFDCRINENIVSILKNSEEVEVYIIDSCDGRLNITETLLVELYLSLCSYLLV